MISEHDLAASHSSFWRSLMPMSEAFVRAMNANLVRFAPAIETRDDVRRRAIISELSARLYAHAVVNPDLLDEEYIFRNKLDRMLSKEVEAYFERWGEGSVGFLVEPWDMREAVRWAKRIKEFVQRTASDEAITIRPMFIGCGLVDDCEGDLLAGSTLYEVKNVSRDFRITDIRQLLTYCALNAASHQYTIERIGLLNARRGVSYNIGLNDLCLATSGSSSADLLREVIGFVSSEQASRQGY